MLFVDRLFLSRVSMVHLSAAMAGGVTSFAISVLFIGTVGYANALVAQYFGANRRSMCSRSVTQALFLGIASYPILLAVIPVLRFLFIAVGQTEEQVGLANQYVSILLAGSIMLVCRQAFVSFFIGIGKTRLALIAMISGMIANIPANYVLIFGKLGFSVLGVRGAALGTLFGNSISLLIILLAYMRTTRTDDFRSRDQWKLHRDLMKRLLRFGLPAGIESFLAVMAFNVFVQLMHSFGPDVAAAVTITFNWDLLAFVPMMGLGMATTALVGQHVGAGDHAGAEKSAFLALRLGGVYAAILTTLFLTATLPLVRLFARGFADPSGNVERLAAILLRLASIYTVADATQLIFAGALRGAGDTVWIMRFSIVIHWVMAGAAIIMVKLLHIGPIPVWCMFIAMILSLGIVMVFRFRSGKWKEMKLIER